MLDKEGFVKLPGERILYRSPPRTSLSLESKSSYPGTQPFALHSSAGCVYLTNQRVCFLRLSDLPGPELTPRLHAQVVYLPAAPVPALRSFSAPILNLHDTHVSAPFIGPNVWRAALQPVPGGGIPAAHSLLEVKMTFKEGGAFDFHSSFERIKERLLQAVDVARESGQIVGDGSETGGGRGGGALSSINMAAIDLEELPAYEEARSSPSIPVLPPPLAPAVPATEDEAGENGVAGGMSNAENARGALDAPLEPPPGYEEVQRSSVADELERSLRRE